MAGASSYAPAVSDITSNAIAAFLVRERSGGDRPLPQSLSAPVPDPAERLVLGRARRKVASRRSQAEWEPSADRRDPVEVLTEAARTRLPDLVPVRNRRMLESAFAFYRGSANVMALDLATTPDAGIDVQLCGDAHLANFGIFASPERSLVFDLNDFDEASPGPFEWDVKRLAASGVLAARSIGADVGWQRKAAMASVTAYRNWMRRYAGMTHLDIWYARIDTDEISNLLAPSERRMVDRAVDKARTRNHLRALDKLTELVDGRRRIVADPPLVTRAGADSALVDQLPAMFDEYRESLAEDRRALFDSYRLVDMARKVVGVGSVGTRCWIMLFQGPNGGPLFLQAKEAGIPAPVLAGRPSVFDHQGQRVVVGQRLLQASSDILLGWTTAPGTGIHYYVRQLWDAKASADVATMSPMGLTTYLSACGWALARAHARTSDAVLLTGYLGDRDRFDRAVTDFAMVYADQAERDHAAFKAAADDGRIPVAPAG